jgi:hypothetical protein
MLVDILVTPAAKAAKSSDESRPAGSERGADDDPWHAACLADLGDTLHFHRTPVPRAVKSLAGDPATGELFTGEHCVGKCRRPSIAATRRLREVRRRRGDPAPGEQLGVHRITEATSWIDEGDAPCLVSLQSIVLDPSGIVLHDLVGDHDVGNPDQGTRGSIRPARSLPHDTRLTEVA